MRSIVIGAGLGGLAAALRLRARGDEVTVVDRLADPGGRARAFRRNGFIFDAGPTILTAPFLIDELFELFDRDARDYVDIRPIDPWYRIEFDDGRRFEYGSDPAAVEAEIRSFDPGAVPAYRRFLQDTEPIYRIGFEKLGDQPFHTAGAMLRALPAMVRLRSDRSVWQRTARYFKDPHLRQVFSFHPLLVGGNPFRTTSIYSLIHFLERQGGVHFAMGGTGALVGGLVRLLEEVGVELRLGAEVEEILVKGNRASGVRLSGGEELAADRVVANADAPAVHARLVPEEHRRRWPRARLDRMRFSMGLFVLYFGTTRTYPRAAHHTIVMGPRYRGLIDDIFDGDELPEDISIYLHVPTRTDPSMAPPGCESMYALVPVPNLRAGIDWETAGAKLRDRLVARLEETVLPGLSSCITEESFVTPSYFADRLGSLHGAGFSLEPTLFQSAWFRFHNRSRDLSGLYLVGAGTHPGAGVPGVLTSAKVLENVLDDEEGRPRRSAGLRRPRAPEELRVAAPTSMAARATNFSLAARLLPKRLRRDLETLYVFCRAVDDLADRGDPEVNRRLLAAIRVALVTGGSPPTVESGRFLRLAADHDLPVDAAVDLVDGVVGDLDPVRLESVDDVLGYGYRVASSVGRLVYALSGAPDPAGEAHAVDLGLAMQLTNIARDVAEDARADRVYLPARWVAPETVLRAVTRADPDARRATAAAATRLLELAERHYESAEDGMVYLPRAFRPGILAAARLYRSIGDEVRRLGPAALERRAFVRRQRRWRIAAGAVLAALAGARFRARPGVRPTHRSSLHEPLERSGLIP